MAILRFARTAGAAALLTVGCSRGVQGPATFAVGNAGATAMLEVNPAPACAVVGTKQFLDLRPDRSQIGLRYEDGQPERWPIVMTGNPIPWLADGIARAERSSAILENPSAPSELRISIVSMTMNEHARFNSSYSFSLIVEFSVVDRRSGKVRWTQRYAGTGSNYGSSGNELGYQETMTRGLDDLVTKAFSDPAIHAALCGTTPDQSATPK
jgi:hypothetical protein